MLCSKEDEPNVKRPGLVDKLTAVQLLCIGYAAIVVLGAGLLSLPAASATGEPHRYLDSLFMAASGISTTGLVVVDPGSQYSRFGQLVLLAIFQIGGIGYMAVFVSVTSLFRVRSSINTRLMAGESLAGAEMHQLGRFFFAVVGFTAAIEGGGAFLLWLRWRSDFGAEAPYLATFHSISAFCTAGFAVFPDSVVGWRLDRLVNLTIIVVSLLGGIGFTVLVELLEAVRNRLLGRHNGRLSLHSRMAISVTALLVMGGTVLVLAAEHWDAGTPMRDRVLVSAFQVVSASTTDGFNSIDIGAMSRTSLTALMILMFIGASPGSTGGGIKTTSFGLVASWLWGHLRGRDERVEVFHREIPQESVSKAFAVASWFAVIVACDLVLLSATEKGGFLPLLFEIVSALGNTGLSMGLTSSLSDTGRFVLVLTMFIGRVGPLAITRSIAGRVPHPSFRYAAEDLHVG